MKRRKHCIFKYAKDETCRLSTITVILNPKEIAENKKYENLRQLWLGGDH